MEDAQWNPDVLVKALCGYSEGAKRELERVRRNLLGLSNDDKDSMTWKIDEQVSKMEEAINRNSLFLESLVGLVKECDGRDFTFCYTPRGTVQTFLQTLTREWSLEGLSERRDCHERLLKAIDCHFADKTAQDLKVLIPGASVGRLVYDFTKRGFSCTPIDCNILAYFGMELLRQGCKEGGYVIHPFATNTCNRFKAEDHIRAVPFPDVDLSVGDIPAPRFGEFLVSFDKASEKSSYDALVTAFTFDTSPNVLRFIRTAAHCVKPGGLWTNFGPLAYETDHDEGHGVGVELSWEELKHALLHFFDIKEEEFVDSHYAANASSMMMTQYSCIYFSAVRNGKESLGIGSN